MAPLAPAVAQEVPQDAPVWSNPDARSADPDTGVSLEILGQHPATVPADGALDLRIRVTNSTDEELSGLQLRTQHQNALGEASQVDTSLMSNQGEYPWIGPFQQLDGTLAPGEDRQFRLTVPVDGRAGSLNGLALNGPGVYPLLLNLNADLGEAGTSFVAATRTTVTVTGDADDPADPAGTDSRPPGMTMLWPLASAAAPATGQVGDAPDPNELYLPDETLAGELSTGGRLDALLSSWRTAANTPGSEELTEATCLAVDPDLLETVERMASGYRVAATPPSPVEEPVRLRDRWTSGGDSDDSVEGTGADAAASWLADLREAADGQCTVALPFSGADVNAVAALDDPWVSELADRGADTVAEILDTEPARGVVVPGAGYVTDTTVQHLADSDRQTPATVVVADDTLTATSDPVTTLPGGTRALHYPAALGTSLAATGEEPSTSAYSDPLSRRDLDDDSPAERMAAAVGVLDLELGRGEGAGNVLAVPPADWTVDADGASTWLEAVRGHLDDGSARAVSFGSALRGVASDGTTVPPQNDPAPVTEDDVAAARRVTDDLHAFTGIMVNDDNVALTREIFTRPMFDDVLRSLTDDGRRVAAESGGVRQDGVRRRAGVEALTDTLRASVSLLPPGSVFTRTSDSSPLIVVARNGLPLPVQVGVDYDSADGVTLNTPGIQLIPAQGSVTLQMTTSIPEHVRETDLTMTLDTPDDVQISEPVTVRVASGPGNGALAVVIGVAVVFGLFALTRVTTRRRQLAKRRGSARR